MSAEALPNLSTTAAGDTPVAHDIVEAGNGTVSAETLAAAEGTPRSGGTGKAGKAEKADKAEKQTPMMQQRVWQYRTGIAA